MNYEEQDSLYRDVVVVWRTSNSQAKFEWLRKLWNGVEDRFNQSSEMLITKMNGYLQGKSELSRSAALSELVDEYGPGKIKFCWNTGKLVGVKDDVLIQILGSIYLVHFYIASVLFLEAATLLC